MLNFFTDPFLLKAAESNLPCHFVDPELFFPVSRNTGGHDSAATQRAKRICQDCPIRVECFEYAVKDWRISGVWGGTSEKERSRIRRRGRVAA